MEDLSIQGQPVSEQTRVPVAGAGYTGALRFTRPADTTAYAAGDVAGGSLEFRNMGPPEGHIIITDTELLIDLSAVTASMTSFRLHLYNSMRSAQADNAVWDLLPDDRASYLGYIDLGSPVDCGSTLYVQQSYVNKKVKMGASTSLFGYLVTNGGYTPTSLEAFFIRLNAVGL